MDTVATPGSAPRGADPAAVGSLIAEHFPRIAQAATREDRSRAVDRFVAAAMQADLLGEVLRRLIQQDDAGKRMALEVGSRLPRTPTALPAPVGQCLLPLLGESSLSSQGRTAVAGRLLLDCPDGSAAANRIFQAYSGNVGREKATERLLRLSELLPDRDDLPRRIKALQSPDVESCPRCGTLLPRAEWIDHVWDAHGLISDGKRLQLPWDLISSLVEQYDDTRQEPFLHRAVDLAGRVDPAGGLERLQRLLLADQLPRVQLRERLRRGPESPRDTICPECFARQPAATPPVPEPAVLVGTAYHEQGFRLVLTQTFLGSTLYLQTPQGMLYVGREPAGSHRPRLPLLFGSYAVVLLALATAVALPATILPVWLPVLGLLGVAGGLYAAYRLRPESPPPEARLLDHAWGSVVPGLHQPEFSDFDAGFLNDLAHSSRERGNAAAREPALHRVLMLALETTRARPDAERFLAPLAELAIRDLLRQGRDAIPQLAECLGWVLHGHLRLPRAGQLLDTLPAARQSRSDRARLRVLLLNHAFEAGWQPADLQRLGRACPQLGQAYASEDLDGMARLRWLWQARALRPWQHLGTATTVFELARYPMMAGSYLETHPDLLLFQPLAGNPASPDRLEPILVCEEGVVLHEAVVGRSAAVAVTAPSRTQATFLLHLPGKSLAFATDPTWIATRLQAWSAFLHQQFLPQAPALAKARSRALLERLLTPLRQTCPECQSSFCAAHGTLGFSAAELETPE